MNFKVFIDYLYRYPNKYNYFYNSKNYNKKLKSRKEKKSTHYWKFFEKGQLDCH